MIKLTNSRAGVIDDKINKLRAGIIDDKINKLRAGIIDDKNNKLQNWGYKTTKITSSGARLIERQNSQNVVYCVIEPA